MATAPLFKQVRVVGDGKTKTLVKIVPPMQNKIADQNYPWSNIQNNIQNNTQHDTQHNTQHDTQNNTQHDTQNNTVIADAALFSGMFLAKAFVGIFLLFRLVTKERFFSLQKWTAKKKNSIKRIRKRLARNTQIYTGSINTYF